jgi:pimeloyl-ACP methyl ester carboxylesterase
MEIRNDDLTLHVAEDGPAGGPPVVLLHGITSSTATYDWLVPALARRFRVLRLDFRGHGRSDRAEGRYDYPAFISDAVAVCEAAGRPAVVIGHSLGGGAAAAVAQQRPDLVRAVVLEDPALVGAAELSSDTQPDEDNPLLDAFKLMREMVPQAQAAGMTVDQGVELIGAMPNPSTGKTMAEEMCPDSIRASVVGLLELDVSVLDPVLAGKLASPVDLARPIGVPGVLLAADPASPDHVVQTEHLEILARTSPQLDAWAVPGASHGIHGALATRSVYEAAVRGLLAAIE